MKEVNIYIKESCDTLDTKDGYYIAVMTTQGGKRKFSNSFKDTTNYRMIIQGAIDAISMLNQPCVINLFTNTTFGMSKIRKGDGSWKEFPKESINMDLLIKLKELIIKGKHELNNFYDKNLVDEAVETNGNPNHLVLKLSEDAYNKLNNKCKKEGRNINQIIESLINTYLNE